VGHLAIVWLLGCVHDPTMASVVATAPAAAPAGFSGDDARVILLHWLEAPRALGDPRRTTTIAELGDALAALGASRIERIAHVAPGPDGDPVREYALVEIIAHFRERAPRRFVLATHFDTRPWADEEIDRERRSLPVPGANDGTSGLAVVLALIEPLLARLPGDVGISVILFDGEELGRPGLGGYCMGSRHLAARIEDGLHPTLASADLGIVLDMVGDADLRVSVEPSSKRFHPALVDHLWGTARALGIDSFDPEVRGGAIVDDHVFLSEAGIPSVLLIDREYTAWHRTTDTPDRVSAASLGDVGTVVLEGILRWYAR